jgi:protein-disulfide isomerase
MEFLVNRRRFLHAAALAAASAPLLTFAGARPSAAAGAIDVAAILNDPDTPVAGNAAGDVTIVAFMDYNCPFCKKSSPDLEKFVDDDGKVRLVYKDWPILTNASVAGAHIALAAKYQGKYREAHVAMMSIRSQKIDDASLRAAVKGAGIDMAQLDADVKAHDADISTLLKRNMSEADSLGLQATPVFLIGPFKVEKALNYDEFKATVADFRARIAK